MEISAKSLQIGDWVMSKELKTPVKVCSIMNHYETTIYFCCQGNEFIVNSYQLEPIPLTPEILEKNGFEFDDVIPECRMFMGIDDRVALRNDKEYMNSDNEWHVHIDSEDYCTIANCELTYVHELQNILRLCKIYKEIVV
jgi:hypothetical protein